MLPLPLNTNVLTGTTSVSDADAKVIMENVRLNQVALDEYQKKVQRVVLELYDLVADGLLKLENFMNFYL